MAPPLVGGDVCEGIVKCTLAALHVTNSSNFLYSEKGTECIMPNCMTQLNFHFTKTTLLTV